jgi:hypothetical protein
MKQNKIKSYVLLLLSGTVFLMIGIGVYSFLRETKPPILIMVFNWLNINPDNHYQIKSDNYFLKYVITRHVLVYNFCFMGRIGY